MADGIRVAAAPKAQRLAQRLAIDLGRQVRDERDRRRWTLAQLAEKAAMSIATVHRIEFGAASSVDGYARLAVALGLEARFALGSERPTAAVRDADAVHAAMGEVEAAHLLGRTHEVLLDEPYQHYQFAGRADLVAIDRPRRALLHLENRTRFPDIQGAIGSYASKRAYLGAELAERLGIRGGFASETHVMVALWSSEVLHALRLREATFRSACPDPPEAFVAWWAGEPPATGSTSTLVILDPIAGQRTTRRRWIGLEQVREVEPRYRGYADALTALRRAGLA
jgi:transcriptional regulator with XRE-family HTH domain